MYWNSSPQLFSYGAAYTANSKHQGSLLLNERLMPVRNCSLARKVIQPTSSRHLPFLWRCSSISHFLRLTTFTAHLRHDNYPYIPTKHIVLWYRKFHLCSHVQCIQGEFKVQTTQYKHCNVTTKRMSAHELSWHVINYYSITEMEKEKSWPEMWRETMAIERALNSSIQQAACGNQLKIIDKILKGTCSKRLSNKVGDHI